MKVCKKCKKQVPNKLKICRYCGSDVSKAKIIPSNKKNTKTSTKVQKNIINKKETPKQETEIKVQKEKITKNTKSQNKPKKIKTQKTSTKTNNKFEKVKQILLKLKTKKNLKRIIVSIIVLTLVITVTLSGIKLYHKLFDVGEEVKPNETNKVFDINETIRYKDVNYKVKKVEINETGTEYKKPKDNNQFIVVTIQYENKSDEPVRYSSKNWKLENKDKEQTQRIFTALDVDTALYSGKLVIGATKVGTLVFEQPKKYDSFKLNFYELKEEKKEDKKENEEEQEKPIFSINIKIENKDKEKEKSKEESKNKKTQTTKKETKDKELSKK